MENRTVMGKLSLVNGTVFLPWKQEAACFAEKKRIMELL
jgi:hypothetical protein